MQPILDGIHEYLGWDANFYAGGPEPNKGGVLNMIK